MQIGDLTMRAGGYRTEAGALVRVLRANNAVFDDQVGVVRLLDALLPELGAGLTGVFTEAGLAGREFDEVAEALGGTLIAAFRGAAVEGKSLRDVLRGVLDDILVLSQSSLGGGGSSFLGTLLNSAVGALFGTATAAAPAAASTIAVAKGGVLHNAVVSRPTLFAMAKGYGLMDEAGMAMAA